MGIDSCCPNTGNNATDSTPLLIGHAGTGQGWAYPAQLPPQVQGAVSSPDIPYKCIQLTDILQAHRTGSCTTFKALNSHQLCNNPVLDKASHSALFVSSVAAALAV